MRRFSLALLVITFAASAGFAAERVQVVDELRGADGTIAIESVDHEAGHVTAVVRNTSSRPVSDVRLLVQLVYDWPQEMAPGEASPSRATVVRIPGPLAPGATARVDAPIGASVTLAGGHFEPRVQVLGFVTEGG